MSLNAVQKAEIVKKYQRVATDTGSPEVQVALLSSRIEYLTNHFKTHKHDNHSRYGLGKLVSKRRKLLNYLKQTDIERYRRLIEGLELRY